MRQFLSNGNQSIALEIIFVKSFKSNSIRLSVRSEICINNKLLRTNFQIILVNNNYFAHDNWNLIKLTQPELQLLYVNTSDINTTLQIVKNNLFTPELFRCLAKYKRFVVNPRVVLHHEKFSIQPDLGVKKHPLLLAGTIVFQEKGEPMMI